MHELPVQRALAQVRALRRTGDHAAALALLNGLEREHPDSGLLWQERAQSLRSLGDVGAALVAFRRAVELNDTLTGSWQALRELHISGGRLGDAAHAAACLAKLASLPPQLTLGSGLLHEGALDAAETVVRDYLCRHGPHVEGMRILAQIAVKLRILDDAELLLENVLVRKPDYHDARCEYATVLAQRRRYLPAQAEVRKLLRIDPRNPSWRLLYASVCDGLGEHDEALRVYQQLLNESPGDAGIELAIAQVLRSRGNGAESIAAFRSAAALPGGAGSGYLALANMKTYRFSDAEIAHMREAEAASSIVATERYQLCFALGKALEDRKEYAESFGYYERGNALKRAELKYNPDIAERSLRLQAAVCTAEFFEARRGAGCLSADPIFILGLPRSGSTLIEQILASHSRVDGTLELPDLPLLVQQFRNRRADEPPRYPAVLAELTPEELRALGEAYLERTRVHRRGAPFFIDKMPGNFKDVGFIHLILPNARIIDARRAPMACCFGNFKQLFATGHEFAYSLADVGRYYRNYIELMEHWDRALPGKILHVRHEDVVDDLEGSVRCMLEFCGLDFEPACLEFWKTERGVRTVSSEQVRRPIYREGLEQWRNYEPWLAPLRSALGSLADS